MTAMINYTADDNLSFYAYINKPSCTQLHKKNTTWKGFSKSNLVANVTPYEFPHRTNVLSRSAANNIWSRTTRSGRRGDDQDADVAESTLLSLSSQSHAGIGARDRETTRAPCTRIERCQPGAARHRRGAQHTHICAHYHDARGRRVQGCAIRAPVV